MNYMVGIWVVLGLLLVTPAQAADEEDKDHVETC